jgi:hypothetical protein
MSDFTEQELRDEREDNWARHGLGTAFGDSTVSICDLAERLRPRMRPEVPPAERVSLRGFRKGDQVRVPAPERTPAIMAYTLPAYDGTWTVTGVANPFVDGPDEQIGLQSNALPQFGLFTTDEHIERI